MEKNGTHTRNLMGYSLSLLEPTSFNLNSFAGNKALKTKNYFPRTEN